MRSMVIDVDKVGSGSDAVTYMLFACREVGSMGDGSGVVTCMLFAWSV